MHVLHLHTSFEGHLTLISQSLLELRNTLRPRITFPLLRYHSLTGHDVTCPTPTERSFYVHVPPTGQSDRQSLSLRDLAN